MEGVRVGVPQTYFYDDLPPDVGEALEAARQQLAGCSQTITPGTLHFIRERNHSKY